MNTKIDRCAVIKKELKAIMDEFQPKFNLNHIRIDFQTGESYMYGSPDKRLDINSCAKTIVSIAVGICLQETSLSLEDYFMDYFPDNKETSSVGTEAIKIKHLLQMTAGKELQSLSQVPPNNEKWETDRLAWFVETPLSWQPGEYFYYSSHCSYVLGRIIEMIKGEDINDFLKSRFWDHLNIGKPQWKTCPQGHTICSGYISLSCEELSRVGLMLLNCGKYNGKQILSSDYVKNMMQKIVPSRDPFFEDPEGTCGYGYLIWKCSHPNTFRMWGAGGNYCIINYDLNCCITITSKMDLKKWRSLSNNDNNILRKVYSIFRTIEP
jgi:CubicO group peptidase (beta-lactamase class C family)